MLWGECFLLGKGHLYKGLNAGVPIIVAHVVLLKNNYLLMKDFVFSEYIYCNNLNLSVLFLFILLFWFLVLFVGVLAGFLYSDYLSFVFMFICDLSPSTARVYVCTIWSFLGLWYIHCHWFHLSFLKVSRCCLISLSLSLSHYVTLRYYYILLTSLFLY